MAKARKPSALRNRKQTKGTKQNQKQDKRTSVVGKKSKEKKETGKVNQETLKNGKKLYQRKKREKNLSDTDDSEFEIAEKTNEVAKLEQIKFNDENETDDKPFNARELVKNQNKKQKSQSGGFQKIGLSHLILRGVLHKGYKVPTPIQRKTIPLIMDGKDVVAMARTGSGKTAAFLIPMFEKLQVHSTKGARALILSPTRELALQTMKFTKELGKHLDLKFTLVLGGDSMENQFASLHQNPDIIIATPGRFLHLLVEMETKRLDSIEYVVFDEADRLFEMGFQEQLQEIIRRLPESRQTVLFSATLPKVLVDFATAGLTDPTLIRLDVDTKISDKLKMKFFLLRHEDKLASLLYLLQEVISSDEQTVIFVSTKYHVEYLKELLSNTGLTCTHIYSSLDQTARKINIAKFRKKLCMVMIVTDIAARGIDIPMLDNVINYDFPSKPKMFVHRVGRVARAGRSGTAYSFVMKDELGFVMDLHLFLGRPLKFPNSQHTTDSDGILGSIPQGLIADKQEYVKNAQQTNFNLNAMQKVMLNGYKNYIKSRECASTESIKRCKEIDLSSVSMHPFFMNSGKETNEHLTKLLSNLQKFKPNLTVFETMNTKKSRDSEHIMKVKRDYHSSVIERQKQKLRDKPSEDIREEKLSSISDETYIADSFQSKVGYKDVNYIPRQASDYHGEQGFSVKSFKNEANQLAVDMTTDDAAMMRQNMAAKKWDRKRKKFVSTDGNKPKKIKTESGSYIPASYKSKRYGEWKKKNFMASQRVNDEDANEPTLHYRSATISRKGKSQPPKKKTNFGKMPAKKPGKGTLKTKEQMIKNRIRVDRQKSWRTQKSSGGGKGGKRKR